MIDCPDCRRMEDENAVLREKLAGYEGDGSLPTPHSWAVRPTGRRILEILLRNTLVTREALYRSLYADHYDNPPRDEIVKVQVCYLRRAITPLGIEIKTLWGVGYEMPADSKVRLKELLNNLKAERPAA